MTGNPANDDTLRSLREALRVSPDNVPLRKHVAKLLADGGRLEDAEAEYRRALSHAADDDDLKLSLADVFRRQDKLREAVVLVEAIIDGASPSARAYLTHARLLAVSGDPDRAVRQYQKAIEEDPDVADPAFALQIGMFDKEEPDLATPEEEVDGRVRAASDEAGPSAEPDIPLEQPESKFDDVGGMSGVKEEISMKIILPLTQPELFEAYGKKAGGGILMYGPPGCGKTHLARATAGEVRARFMAIGIHEVLDMWIGESERKLHELFEQARRHAPCVLFFDEIDALGGARSDMRGSTGRQLVNQFLSELDGVKSANEGLLVLGATNAPWHLDSAFRRPGRFDRVIFVPPPDREARVEILRLILEGKPQTDIDLAAVAKKTNDFSGADLKATVESAVEDKLREAIRDRKASPLRTKDLVAALKTVKPTTKEWFSTAKNYALYSNEGGVYDDILSYLKLK